MPMEILEGDRLLIRLARDHEFAKLLPIYNCKDNMQYILDGRHVWTEAAIRAKWRSLNARLGEGYGLRVVEEKASGKIIGEAGILLLERSRHQHPELGFMLDKAQRGKGLGSEVVNSLLHFAFDELCLHELRAGVLRANIASRRLLEKSGFCFLYQSQHQAGKPLDYLQITQDQFDSRKPVG